jgi:hypothetical protein
VSVDGNGRGLRPLFGRFRTVPRQWLVVGAGVVVAVSLFVVVAVSGGDAGSVATGATGGDGVSTEAPSTSTPATSTSVRPTTSRVSTTSSTSTSVPRRTQLDDYELDVDEDDPAVVARPIPTEPTDATPPSTLAPPPWAASTRTTAGGHVGTDVGCTTDLGAESLDRFFAERVGPVIGWDYQHVYPLGGDRYLWLFQDTFVDHAGVVGNLGQARFVHNAALVQQGRCFTLLHRGTTNKPAPFEEGDGSGKPLSSWFWPMGGELTGGTLGVFWVQMRKDTYDPKPPDGLGWHPERLWLATYDATTLKRLSFTPATDPGVTPIFGYAVSSDTTHTYLFGNTFEQNLVREGGFWNGPHSATEMWLARVPRGQLTAPLEYWSPLGWSPNRIDAAPFMQRFYTENPMQPRYLDGQWVSATDVDGYWGEALAIDVAADPWGPWTTVDFFGLQPRSNDPLKNTYHAHLMPWRDRFGSVVVSVSNNARNMLRDAWPRPDRYRPMFTYSAFAPTPPPATIPPTQPPPPPTEPTTTPAPTTLAPTTVATTTTLPPTTVATTTTTSTSTTTTTTTTSTTTTSTTVAPTVAPGG